MPNLCAMFIVDVLFIYATFLAAGVQAINDIKRECKSIVYDRKNI